MSDHTSLPASSELPLTTLGLQSRSRLPHASSADRPSLDQPSPLPPPADRFTNAQPPTSDWKALIAFGLTCALVLLSASNFLRFYSRIQTQRQQQEQTQLAQAEQMSREGDFTACLQMSRLTPTSSLYEQSQRLQQACQKSLDTALLQEAQSLAEAGQIKAAIARIETISSPALQHQIATLLDAWAKRLLELATEYYQAGDLLAAEQIALTYLPEPRLQEQAQQFVVDMRSDWFRQQSYFESAQAALDADQLDRALQDLQQITHPSWRSQVQPLLAQVHARQLELEDLQATAQQALAQEQFGRAIELVEQLPDTEPWATTKQVISSQVSRAQSQKIIQQILKWGVVILLILLIFVR